jgi:hypothetical protein
MCVVLGLHVMTVGDVSVVPSLLVIALFMVLRRHAVVLGSMLVMFSCLTVMFTAFF